MNLAWLIHAPGGYGKWQALVQAATALLCEAPLAQPAAPGSAVARLPAALRRSAACGRCASCALMAAGTHPDFAAVVPQALWPVLGLNQGGEDDAAGDAGKSASQDIRIEQIRRLNDWAVNTSHRGRAKVALIYPADALNPAAANALLKTLEEPPPGVQFLLAAHRLDALLPTIRSRCRHAAMPRPGADEARRQLGGSGQIDAVRAWCQDAVYQPDPALGLEWVMSLVDGAARNAPAVVLSTALPAPADPATGVTALLKLCSDLQRVQAGAPALYLPQRADTLTSLARRIAPEALNGLLQRLLARQRLAGFALHQALAGDVLRLEFAQLFSSPGGNDGLSEVASIPVRRGLDAGRFRGHSGD